MRGTIIHYSGSDGRGLVAADRRQIPFEIRQWRSQVAPSVNQVVDLEFEDQSLASVAVVPEHILLKERASQLTARIGASAAPVLSSLRETANANAGAPAGLVRRLGKPLVACHAAFTLSALLLPFLSISSPFGQTGRSYTLFGLDKISESLGASVSGSAWALLAILAPLLPMAWRSRWAWIALLLPLLATLKPAFDIVGAARQASRAMSDAFGAEISAQIARQVADMLGIGIGAWVCLACALPVAGIGLKRVLLPPSA